MKNMVLIHGLNMDCNGLNTNEYGIEFNHLRVKNSLHVEMAFITIYLVQSMGEKALYDTLKYILSNIFSRVKPFGNEKSTKIEIGLNDKLETIEFNFELTEPQKDKLVQAAIEKFSQK